MTRNEQILLIMSWARSYHGLALQDCVMLATRVLDQDFSGSISEADPAEVMSSMDKRYFEAQSQGEVIVSQDGNVPCWEDHGFVRPPVLAEPTSVILSDDTIVDMTYVDIQPITLVSGGTIPVLSDEQREVILPIVFSNPKEITQREINALISETPEMFIPETHVEQVAIDVYRDAQKNVDAQRGAMMRERDNQHKRDLEFRKKWLEEHPEAQADEAFDHGHGHTH